MMAEIMHEQMPNPTRTRMTLESNWNRMNTYGVLDYLIKRPEDQEAVKQLLLQNHALLSELFRAFSISRPENQGVLTMDFHGFSAMVASLGILGDDVDQELLARIYADCFNPVLQDDTRLAMSLTLDHFFLTLIQLALHVYVDRLQIIKHLPTLSWKAIGRKRSVLLQSTGIERYDIGLSLQRLIEEFVMTFAASKLTTFVVKEAIASPEVLVAMADQHEVSLPILMDRTQFSPF